MAAITNQYTPTDNPYSCAATLYRVKEGFTSLVEGKTFGNMEATVVVNPPNRNKEENKKPTPSFLKDFTLNKPKSPVNAISGKIQSQGRSIKL